MRQVSRLFGILLWIFCSYSVYGIVVTVGPTYYDRQGGDTEMRLVSVGVSTAQWSLKDGKTDKEETAIALAIVRPEPDMIDLDLERSEIKVFCDDKETDFLDDRKDKKGATGLVEVTQPTSYSQSLNFKIRASRLPNPRAGKIRLEGSLVLITGTNKTNVENKDVPVKEGSEINVGPYMMKITKVGAPDIKKFPWVQNQNAVAMTIEGENNRRIIRQLQFTDANGNHANTSMVSANYGGEDGKITYEYILMNQMDKINISVAYWSGTEETVLPFEFEIGLDAEPQDIK